MNAGPAREMTLEEYVGRLPSGHLARIELAAVNAEIGRLDKVIMEYRRDAEAVKAENERLKYNAKFHGIDACEEAVNDKENKRPHSIHCYPSKVARMLSVAQAENERLKAWKDSVMKLESSWDIQAVAKALGIQLGLPIHPGILPGIEKLKKENELYREMLGLGGEESVDTHITNGKIPRPRHESKLPNICDDCASGPDCTDSGCPHRDED